MKQFKFLWLVMCILGAGCSVGPDYVRPDTKIPADYKEAKGTWKVATPQDQIPRGKWWTIFDEPLLNELEEKADRANQSLVAADAQYRQALALVDQARAGFFPVIEAVGSDIKSKSVGLSTSGSSGRFSRISENPQANFQATWEPDLWGSVRRQVEADEATAQSSLANREGVRLSIQASLAQYYFQIWALDVSQKQLDEKVAAYTKFLDKIKNQYTEGTSSRLVVLQAESQLQTAQAQAIDNGISRAQFEHAIAVLIGEPPSNFSIPVKTCPVKIPDVPLEVPSALLERRPDIAQAERNMAQANAEIGVAVSAYYPVLSLTGLRGYSSFNTFSHLFSAPNIVWAIGASLTQVVFDAGARYSAVRGADAGYEATVGTYRQTVLAAFQNVEDNLVSVRLLKDETKVLDAAVVTAEREYTFTNNGYKAGIQASTDVLNALVNLYAAKETAIAAHGRQLTSIVGLIKALGGGTDQREDS